MPKCHLSEPLRSGNAMPTDLKTLRNRLEQCLGQRQKVRHDIRKLKSVIKKNADSLVCHEQAREIIRAVGLEMQKRLQYHISDVASLALESVYDEPYELVAEFVQRHNKTECDLYFVRDGNRFDPMEDSGGGVVNVASFALRVASWNMQRPISRNVLVLDEPFNNVSPDLMPRVGEMIKQISKKLKLQIIMVTHSDDLIETADRSFTITKRKGASIVKNEKK